MTRTATIDRAKISPGQLAVAVVYAIVAVNVDEI
jgi:hypothetical protein